MMDVLRNQVIERKVIDLHPGERQFKEVPYQPEETDVEAVDLAAGGGEQSDNSRGQAGRRAADAGERPRCAAPGSTAALSAQDGLPSMSTHFPGSRPLSSSYRDYQRQRQLTLGDLLLENRIILLQGEIHDGNANELVMKLLYLQSENRRKDIHFYINSPGGSVSATLAIYDTMQILSCPVATYCVGLAASGGAVLLAGGAKGKRFALPNAKVMIHQPYGQVGGQVSDIEIQAQEILKTRDVLNLILAGHTGQPIERIAKDTDRDFYMTRRRGQGLRRGRRHPHQAEVDRRRGQMK